VVAGATALPAGPWHRSTQALVDVLGSVVVGLPPLRDRAVDIPLLANAFVQGAGDAESLRIDADALALLQRYAWPGNVAELRAVMERARLLARGGVIRADDLPLDAASGSLQLTDIERRHIAAVLRTCGWHQGRAAAALDISPKTLYRKIRAYGLARPRPDARA
jgi:transcriptional regulator of acetoin/glycerol metabolism